MGFFDFVKKEHKTMNINAALKNLPESAVIIDVREPQEYAQGHIPGSINVPVMAIRCIGERVPDKNTPLFVYCRSGARSNRAVMYLLDTGYSDVTDMGGVASYRGTLET
jgi:rhodanese-related sulfurtransferase